MLEASQCDEGTSKRMLTDVKMDQVFAFFAILNHHGLKRAAHAIAKDPSTLRKRIDALEDSLGKKLFDSLSEARLTADGQDFYRVSRDVYISLQRFVGDEPGVDCKTNRNGWTNNNSAGV